MLRDPRPRPRPFLEVLALAALLGACANQFPGDPGGGGGGGGGGSGGADPWAKVRESDPPRIASGWSAPVRLAVSGDYWGDSLWVDWDGSRIFFMVYEGDAMTDVMIKGKPTSDPDVYVSDYPFETKRKVTDFNLSHPVWGCAGPMIDANGDFWFMSNREWEKNKKIDPDIYRNGEYLPFNTDDWYTNPHYCAATDELWFDRDDTEIMVLENAAKNGYSGKARVLPKPVNSHREGIKESQPWLSTDGKRMYFSSTRGGTLSIYTTERAGPGAAWSEPQPVIWGCKIGVGEPTLTADESRLFYEQILRNGKGAFTTEFFYVERLGASQSAPPAAPPPEAAAAPEQAFEALALADFQGLGATKSAKVGGPNAVLTWDYAFKANPFPMLIQSGLRGAAGRKGVSLRLASEKNTTISVTLSEQGGIRYNHLLEVSAGSALQTYTIPFNAFANQPDSPDPNGKLDLDKIEALGLIDAKAILQGAKGQNSVRIQHIGLMR